MLTKVSPETGVGGREGSLHAGDAGVGVRSATPPRVVVSCADAVTTGAVADRTRWGGRVVAAERSVLSRCRWARDFGGGEGREGRRGEVALRWIAFVFSATTFNCTSR